MDIDLYFIFLVTTVMLILVPGPAAITVASAGAAHGSRKGLLAVLGVASADVIFFALSATGIASLILASNMMFSVIKWFGVAYLLYLGVVAFFTKAGAIRIIGKYKYEKPGKLFSQGLVVQLANPKALMYFSALLPQFVNPNDPIIFQMLLMGMSCLLADLIVYSGFNQMGDRLAKQKLKAWVVNMLNKTAGIALISTSIKMASLEYRK